MNIRSHRLTVLYQDIKCFLDKEVGIQHYQAKGQRQNIIAGANFEEVADRFLSGTISSCTTSARAPNDRIPQGKPRILQGEQGNIEGTQRRTRP